MRWNHSGCQAVERSGDGSAQVANKGSGSFGLLLRGVVNRGFGEGGSCTS